MVTYIRIIYSQYINPSGTETGIFRENYINTVFADAPAPGVGMQPWYWLHDISAFAFHEKVFKKLVPSKCWKMIEWR